MTIIQKKAAGILARAGFRKKSTQTPVDPERSHAAALNDQQVDVAALLETNLALIQRLQLDPTPHQRIAGDVATYPGITRSHAVAMNALLTSVIDAEELINGWAPDFVRLPREAMRATAEWEEHAREFATATHRWYSAGS